MVTFVPCRIAHPTAWITLVGATWCTTSSYAYGRELVYLNFAGDRYTSPAEEQPERAVARTSELVARLGVSELVIAPLADDPQVPREALLAAIVGEVERLWQAYDIRFVLEEPIDDRYTVVSVGGHAGALGLDRAYGWSPSDCGNQNPRNVVFVFAETLAEQSASVDTSFLAAIISQELAHAYGLDHIEGADDLLMRPIPTATGGHRFSSSCLPVVAAPMGGPAVNVCNTHPGCADGQQNDHAALLEVIGTAMQDSTGDGSSTNATTSTNSSDTPDTGENGQSSAPTTESTNGSLHPSNGESNNNGCQLVGDPRSWWASLLYLGWAVRGRRRKPLAPNAIKQSHIEVQGE